MIFLEKLKKEYIIKQQMGAGGSKNKDSKIDPKQAAALKGNITQAIEKQKTLNS